MASMFSHSHLTPFFAFGFEDLTALLRVLANRFLDPAFAAMQSHHWTAEQQQLILFGEIPLQQAEHLGQRLADAYANKLADRESAIYISALLNRNDEAIASKQAQSGESLAVLRQKLLPAKQLMRLFCSHIRHTALKELLSLPHAPTQPSDLAHKLMGLATAEDVVQSLDLLTCLGFTYFDYETGQYRCHSQAETLQSRPARADAKNFYQNIFQQAELALAKQSDSTREFNSLTVRLTAEAAEHLKHLLRQFSRNILSLDAVAEGAEIHQVVLLQFPLTRGTST